MGRAIGGLHKIAKGLLLAAVPDHANDKRVRNATHFTRRLDLAFLSKSFLLAVTTVLS